LRKTIALGVLALTLALAAAFAVIVLYFVLVFLGWGATVPAQVQITVDRQGVPYDRLVIVLAETASRHGFAKRQRSKSKFAVFTNDGRSVEISVDYPSPNIDLGLTMISVMDRNNSNQSIHIAKAISEDIAIQFPTKRVHVQIDPKQYACKGHECTFEMSLPIDVSKMPRWLSL
jgi:hypothetical protein